MKILPIDFEIEDMAGTEKAISLGRPAAWRVRQRSQRKDGQGNGKKSETRPYRLLYGNR